MDKDRFEQIFNGELGGMNAHIAQDPQELWQVVQRLNVLRPRRALEIGVDYGGTTRFWQLLTDGLVIAIDVDLEKVVVDFSGHAPPLLLRGDSTDPETIASAKKRAPYDFLFIDGGHDYPTVKSDWDNYSPMVRPGGLVGFHDVGAVGTGPNVLVKEIGEAGFHCEIFPGHKGTALVDIPE
jgi:predicted O-methyltransferase YrrM